MRCRCWLAGRLRRGGINHELMHGGSREAAIELYGYIGREGIYAVGALENLEGEITILDGEMWISRPVDGGGYQTTRSVTDEGAALLVESRASKNQWSLAVEIKQDTTLEELGTVVIEMARKARLNVDGPFPFLVKAKFPQLLIHIVDGTKIRPDDTPDH